jgi:hypothetical protein
VTRFYTVTVRGEIPPDIRERVAHAHVQAIAVQEARYHEKTAEDQSAACDIEEDVDAAGATPD